MIGLLECPVLCHPQQNCVESRSFFHAPDVPGLYESSGRCDDLFVGANRLAQPTSSNPVWCHLVRDGSVVTRAETFPTFHNESMVHVSLASFKRRLSVCVFLEAGVEPAALANQPWGVIML
eukprot:5989700-Pyramimonas_sp.AAC.1